MPWEARFEQLVKEDLLWEVMSLKFEKGREGKGTLIFERKAQWEACCVTSLVGLKMA